MGRGRGERKRKGPANNDYVYLIFPLFYSFSFFDRWMDGWAGLAGRQMDSAMNTFPYLPLKR